MEASVLLRTFWCGRKSLLAFLRSVPRHSPVIYTIALSAVRPYVDRCGSAQMFKSMNFYTRSDAASVNLCC